MKDMIKLKSVFAIFASLVVGVANAAGDAHGAEHGIPSLAILFQAINFGLFVTILVVLLRGKVANHFKERHNDFFAAKRKADEMKDRAQKLKQDIAGKLADLEKTEKTSIENAQKEAQKLRDGLIQEAQELSQKIRIEADKAVKNEVARAKEDLRLALLENAISVARETAAKSISAGDQTRLRREFVDNIQAVK